MCQLFLGMFIELSQHFAPDDTFSFKLKLETFEGHSEVLI